MTAPRYARLASTILARLGAAPPPPPDPDDRAQTIAAIARAIETNRRRRRVRRWAAACGAAVAVGLAGFGGYELTARGVPVARAPTTGSLAIVAHPVSGGGSSVVVSGAPAPLDDGRLLGPGSRVVTPPNGRAMLSFSTGSTVLLREGTDMTVATEGATQRLQLDAGSVELHVAKLAPDHRFIVGTPDSEVEVRGTRFSVSIVAADPECGGGVRTRVVVTEGVVVVRHAGVEVAVAIGEPWPGGCLRAPSAATVAALGPPSSARIPVVRSAGSVGSTLADQNDLFASAASAKRRGDARGALAALDRFLVTYPASPLTESVMVERMRIAHQQIGARDRSEVAAKEYLARYPDGFAHAEAEAIVAERP
jgi:hypothetical protein